MERVGLNVRQCSVFGKEEKYRQSEEEKPEQQPLVAAAVTPRTLKSMFMMVFVVLVLVN